MPRPKEIPILIALLVAAMAFILWYVADRKARMRAAPAAEPRNVGPLAPADPPKP